METLSLEQGWLLITGIGVAAYLLALIIEAVADHVAKRGDWRN